MRSLKDAVLTFLGGVALFILLGRLDPSVVLLVNPFAAAVIVIGCRGGPTWGAAAGTAAGLLQDALTFRVFGLAGLTKTILGFFSGVVSRRINVAPAGRSFVFGFFMALLELILWVALYVLVFGERVYIRNGLLVLQPVVTAALSSLVLFLLRRDPAPEP
jgi:rod shape-determining protein MreD